MSLYKYNITVEVNDEDNKYSEMTIRLGIKNAIQRHLRHISIHNFFDNSDIGRVNCPISELILNYKPSPQVSLCLREKRFALESYWKWLRW